MNFYKSTDLACESYVRNCEKNKENGIISSLDSILGYDLIKTEITNEIGEKITGKRMGKYLTLYLGDAYKYNEKEKKNMSGALALSINELLKEQSIKGHTFLVVGLGNKNISSDSLGSICIEKMTPTHHLIGDKKIFQKFGYDLALFSSPVLGQSGIESGNLVKMVKNEVNADCVIAIDSCITNSPNRLCRTIQLSSTGISPGSGINASRSEISKKTLGIPVISIGVPCAICLSSLIYSTLSESMVNIDTEKLREYEQIYLSPSDVNLSLDTFSSIIKNGIISAIKGYI